MLNAVFSLPNIGLALVGGLLIDRYGPVRVALWTAGTCFVGSALTAIGSPYAVMVCGRLLFGVSEEALFIALLLTFGTQLLSLTFLLLGTTHFSLWISTAMMGISFSVVPAIIWPATAMLVDARRLGLALGLINTVQNAALAASNIFAGWLNDIAGAGPRNPAGYDAMLWFLGIQSLTALVAVVLLWRRESGPHGHGLESARQATAVQPSGAG